MASTNVNYQNFVRVMLILTPGEAEQLKAMMQNPMVPAEEESPEASAVRESIFNELRKAGVQ